MSPAGSFDDLMRRLREGDEDAAAQLFQRFAHRLVGLAQARLDRLTRGKVEAEDVLQSVFRSFFLHHAEGRFELQSWDGLWALLVVLTMRKCGRQVRHFRAACRSLGREAEMTRPTAWEAPDDEPTPAEAAALSDLVDELLRRSSEDERPIIALSLQGLTQTEIGDQIGCTERTVRRVLTRVRQRLQRLIEQEASP